jgi:hypothetical protein
MQRSVSLCNTLIVTKTTVEGCAECFNPLPSKAMAIPKEARGVAANIHVAMPANQNLGK